MPSPDTPRVFISYSSKDTRLVDGLKAALAQAGVDVWLDHERLTPETNDWQEAVRKGILQSTHVIYVASPDAARSQYVIHEVTMAKGEKKPVFAFWIRGDDDKWYDCAPFGWISTQYIDGRGGSLAGGLTALIAALGVVIAAATAIAPAASELSAAEARTPVIELPPASEPAPTPTTPSATPSASPPASEPRRVFYPKPASETPPPSELTSGGPLSRFNAASSSPVADSARTTGPTVSPRRGSGDAAGRGARSRVDRDENSRSARDLSSRGPRASRRADRFDDDDRVDWLGRDENTRRGLFDWLLGEHGKRAPLDDWRSAPYDWDDDPKRDDGWATGSWDTGWATDDELTHLPPATPKRLFSLGFRGVNAHGTPAIIPPLVSVAAGPFLMGSDQTRDPQARSDETPRQRVEVAAFQIATYPVTVAEYALAARAGGVREPPASDGMTWQTQRQQPDHPVVCVSWQDAQAYIAWLRTATGESGWRLPTEAEWEKAARWDPRASASRIYPWGDSFDKARCNTLESGIGHTTSLGSYPAKDARRSGASPCGAEEMAGGVWELTSSLYKPYPYASTDGREAEAASGFRTVRGGSWAYIAEGARAAHRSYLGRWGVVPGVVGFRLAFSSQLPGKAGG